MAGFDLQARSSFLATRLRVPPLREGLLSRIRLTDSLEQSLPNCRLVVVSTPAGYGKTTLLAQWAHASKFQVAWLTIDEEDDDFERFFRSLLACWITVQPTVKESKLGALLGAMAPDPQAVRSAFVSAADDVSDHVVFVLDDYHLITEPAIQRAMAWLIGHLPRTFHFVIACRGAPPLPLARLRGRQELFELRAEDLSFLPEETVAFLTEMKELDLTPHAAARLHGQLEGWITGIQLVAQTLRRNLTDADSLVVSGRHRFIADYLSEDVLGGLEDHVRHFLLQTSVLDQLCGPLCDWVTEQEGGQQMIETLERQDLFLVPLDDNRTWYRYHRLFADFLREELRARHPEEMTGLHCRAARWYLANDMSEPAMDHALAGDEPELVIEILERYLSTKVLGGEFLLVKRWLDSVPEAWYTGYPTLNLGRALFLAFMGALDECVRCVDAAEEQLDASEDAETEVLTARVIALRCLVACLRNDLAQAEMYAQEALQRLPADRLLRASGHPPCARGHVPPEWPLGAGARTLPQRAGLRAQP